MPGSRPQLELGVAARADLQQRVLAAVVQLDARQALGVAAVEAFGEPQNGGQPPDRATAFSREIGVTLVAGSGSGPPMVPRDERHHVDFFGLESAQIAVLD